MSFILGKLETIKFLLFVIHVFKRVDFIILQYLLA
jgi:hypothetical protein